MVALTMFDAQGRPGQTLVCEARVREALRARGLDHGRWPLRDLGDGSLGAVLQAYDAELEGLRERLSVRSVDRVRLQPDHPGWPAMRQQFIAEHTHADAEIRYFLGGTGLFYVRVEGGYVGLLCEAEDWVVVPAGTRHFFDAGEQPQFDALRLFASSDGWKAEPTGATAPDLPLLDAFRDRLLALTGHEAG